MRRPAPLAVLVLALAAALPASAQQATDRDPELAGLLAQRGWYDLARELYEKIEKNPAASKAQQAEGSYGLAWLASMQIASEPKVEKKKELFEKAIKAILAFINNADFKDHPRRAEALSTIAELYQNQGKFYLGAGRSIDKDGTLGQGSFAEAQKLFKSLIDQLEKDRVPAPDTGTPEGDPKAVAFADWTLKMMTAKYNYGVSLFNEAEAYKGSPAKHPAMKKLLEAMNKFFEEQFMWDYEQYLMAYSAFIYMGRGQQLLAETSDAAAAEEAWKKCFNYIGKAISLLSDPENRKSEAVRGLALESAMYTVRAKIAYGDTLKGGKASRQYQEAAKIAGDAMKVLPPTAAKESSGMLVRLEEGRALCKAGMVKDGVEKLDRIKRDAKSDPKLEWAENFAIDIIGEYAGETDMKRAIEAGDNLFERGPAYLSRAVQKFRNAIRAAAKAEDRKLIPYCWMRIGEAYYYMDRFLESAGAYSMVLDNPEFSKTPDAPKVALSMKRTLARLVKATGAPEDKERMRRFLEWATANFPAELGDSTVQETAIVKEEDARKVGPKDKYANQFLDAANLWLQLANKTSSPLREDSTFRAAYNFFLHAHRLNRDAKTKDDQAKAKEYFEKCLEYAKKHLQIVDGLPGKDAAVIRNATGSVLYGMWACNMEIVGRANDALALSEGFEQKFPAAEDTLVMKIMQRRIDSHLQLAKLGDAKPDFDRLAKASDDLDAMVARYQKERLGLDALQNALSALSGSFRIAAAKVADPAVKEAYNIRAAELMFQYFESSAAEPKGDEVEVMADTFYDIATKKMDKALARGDAEEIAKIRGMYDKAFALYERLALSAKLSDESLKAIQSRMVTCLVKAGKFEKAMQELDRLVANDPEKANGSNWEALADCKTEKAKSLPAGGDRNKLIEEAAAIYGDLFMKLGEKAGTHYWRMVYKYCAALYETDPDRLQAYFKQMLVRNIAPTWDNDQWGYKTRLEKLRADNEARLPGKK